MSLPSSSQPAPPPTVIVSPRFCSPNPVDLTFFTKAPWLKSGHAAVTDVNGDVVFKVEDRTESFRSRKVVFDGSGRPVISMQQKLSSLHDRWQVFMGSSADPKDLLFTVKRSSAFQLKTELDVFLAGNSEEEVVDFKVNGSYKKKSCTVYKGDSSMVVAQMSGEYKIVKSSTAESSSSKQKRAFGVAVNPNMDLCFVTALLVIRSQLAQDEDEVIGAAGQAAGQVVGEVAAMAFS